FSLARNIPFAHTALANGTWDRKKWNGIELQGKTLGVIGFGRIGREVAAMALALSMKVIATDDLVDPETIAREGCLSCNLSALLGSADIITIHVPLLPSTRNLISDNQLNMCRPGVRI